MAGSNTKIQPYLCFNAGEYSSDLAGRIDLESFAASSRKLVNMMSQVTGGLKKFYGTYHVANIPVTESDNVKIKLVPFINKEEPLAFVFIQKPLETTVGILSASAYTSIGIKIPAVVDIEAMRWKQINDKVIFVERSVQPFSITYYGKDANDQYMFFTEQVAFAEVPYFPVGATSDYLGKVTANRLDGLVTLTIPAERFDVKTYVVYPLSTISSYTRSTYGNTTVASSRIKLIRKRGTTDTTLVNAVCNKVNYATGDYGRTITIDEISQEKVLQSIRSTYPDTYYNGQFLELPNITDNVAGDTYRLEISIGAITGGDTNFPAESYSSTEYTPTQPTTESLNINSMVGRKIKFYFDDDTVISPWWQTKHVNSGDYAYSNGHWYKATNTGDCGNIQPSHTSGIRSDGAVNWKYVHSGSNSATVVGAPTSNTIQVLVNEGELPRNDTGGVLSFTNYAWSIWGYQNCHPSEVYMTGNRLGMVCNTNGYGAWNALSVTDDYFNFSTEEYGEQLDTSAIVHLIGNNESGVINWVLARKNVYMGSYSGEYNIKSENKALSPTTFTVDNVSNMGGKPVQPLKYKELNMFVGATGKELYTISYDYTIEDYTPQSLGYLTEHIMDKGIRRIEALNNTDRNIYLLHDTNELSLFNYVKEQKVMGFSELDFSADAVIDIVTTYANDKIAGFVATKRASGYITLEVLATEDPIYMFDTVRLEYPEPEEGEEDEPFVPVVSWFANKDVWVKYSNGQFMKTHMDSTGTPELKIPDSQEYIVGIPMVSEIHTQPAFGTKVEGVQQQSISAYLRLKESGAFDYGSSVDFNKYYPAQYWYNDQTYSESHKLFTGDMEISIPLGYTMLGASGDNLYPNNMGIGINIKSDTPEPFNLLSIEEVYK